MNLKRLAVFTSSLFLGLGLAHADNQAQVSMNNQQVQNIEKVVHDYLLKNPEVLIEASQALQVKQQQEMQKQATSFIEKNAKDLLNENVTVMGSNSPNVTIVEFFDYQCGHCQKMQPVVKELLKNNQNLKVVYREFPIFGKSSITASQAAIAAGMQGKYAEMQQLLFTQKKLDDKGIMDLAKQAGLDMKKFEADMQSQKVKDSLNANRQLAENMKLFGTPVFIVMSTPQGQYNSAVHPVLIPGSTSLENLQQMVAQASQAK
jgi:protein-disulfide isomerase